MKLIIIILTYLSLYCFGYTKSLFIRNKRFIVRGLPLNYSMPITFSIARNLNSTPIIQAINAVRRNTCITFSRVSTGPSQIRFVSGRRCSSFIGRISTGRANVVTMAPKCLTRGAVQHFLGHALGLFSEETRPDRDSFVTIQQSNVRPNFIAVFDKNIDGNAIITNVHYDYGSVMHNAVGFLTRNKQPTMTLVYPRFAPVVGQRAGFSFNDYKILNAFYCSNRCTNTINCQNNGYQDPNNCNQCKCPSFHTGNQCQNIKPSQNGCGTQNFNVNQTVGRLRVSGAKRCYYQFTTTPGSQIQLNIVAARLPGGRCWRNKGIEVRIFLDKSVSGARFCGKVGRRSLRSFNNTILLQYVGRKTNHMMRINFRRV
uniref:Metalloendopeptidase n=1 Tax=Parastrongyloides trichosuri TaxID=131310 RepID=A0A0N4ZSH5_PARTI